VEVFPLVDPVGCCIVGDFLFFNSVDGWGSMGHWLAVQGGGQAARRIGSLMHHCHFSSCFYKGRYYTAKRQPGNHPICSQPEGQSRLASSWKWQCNKILLW